MKFLLDTHTLIWALDANPRISRRSLEAIENAQNTILVSTVSVWEISVKKALGKFDFEGISIEELPMYLEEMLFDILPLNLAEAASFHRLDVYYHRDPFDRMLTWQAISNDYTLITKDADIQRYKQVGLKTFW